MPPRTKRLISAFFKGKKLSEESDSSEHYSGSESSEPERNLLETNGSDQSSGSEVHSDVSFASQSEDSSSEEESEFIDKESNYGELPDDLDKLDFNVFALKERDPDTVYALSYDVALKIGLRDSSSLFHRYTELKRLWTTDFEREYLVSIHALSANVKRKNIGIVDVRQLIGVLGLESLCSSDFSTTRHEAPHSDEELGQKPKRWTKQMQQFKPPNTHSLEELQRQIVHKLNQAEQEQLNLTHFNDDVSLRALLDATSFNRKFSGKFAENSKKRPLYLLQMSISEQIQLKNAVEHAKISTSLFSETSTDIPYTTVESRPYPIALMKGQYCDNEKSTESCLRLNAKSLIRRAKAGVPRIKM